MTEPPIDLLEPWSLVGERMARRARWAAAVQGFLMLGVTAAIVVAGFTGFGNSLPACVLISLLGGWGLALIGRGKQILERRKGPTIAVLVLSLVLALLASVPIVGAGWVLLTRQGTFNEDLGSLLFMAVFIAMAVSGYVAAWYCIQTLRHFPRPLGTAFQVEMVRPADERGETK